MVYFRSAGHSLHSVLCLDLLLHHRIVFRGVLLNLFDHALDFLVREAVLVVCNGDLAILIKTRGLFLGEHVHHTVGV